LALFELGTVLEERLEILASVVERRLALLGVVSRLRAILLNIGLLRDCRSSRKRGYGH